MKDYPTQKARLSKRQAQILQYIREAVETRGFPPSIREIGEAVGLSSSSTVHSHLRSLENKGYLKRNPSRPRSIEIVNHNRASQRVINLPIGLPGNFPHDGSKTISLPYELGCSKESFIYEVQEEHSAESIKSGDLVVVNQGANLSLGDMVLQQIEAGRYGIRRIDKNTDNQKVAGKIVSVIRKLED